MNLALRQPIALHQAEAMLAFVDPHERETWLAVGMALHAEFGDEAADAWDHLHLRNIAFSGKSCGPRLAVGIEQSTACAVRRWDLRPDDWHRIWPELIGTDGAPPVPEPIARAA